VEELDLCLEKLMSGSASLKNNALARDALKAMENVYNHAAFAEIACQANSVLPPSSPTPMARTPAPSSTTRPRQVRIPVEEMGESVLGSIYATSTPSTRRRSSSSSVSFTHVAPIDLFETGSTYP